MNRQWKLNDYQRRAVEDMSRACLVNACVGSGKTTVLTEKIRYLHEMRGVPFEDMVVLTFTNKAAEEIAGRLGIKGQVATLKKGDKDQIDATQEEVACFGTFHGVARYLLENKLPIEEAGWHPGFTILEPEEEEELAKALIKENGLKIRYMNRLRKRLENGSGNSSDREDFEKLLELLYRERRAQNRMNFDDLIRECIKLLETHPLDPKWLIVDELQDCNGMQVTFLKRLRGENTNFFAVGDPNQMIYGFRGSQDSLFYRIQEAFGATELSLPVNYRCNPVILAAANKFRQFGSVISSAFESEPVGEKIPVVNYYDPFQEAEQLGDKIKKLHEEGLPLREIAVLYRLKEQGEALQGFFERQEIPYETVETEEDTEGVRLLTLHGSKGLEFHTVFIIGLNQGLLPLNTGRNFDTEEERRLFFVGITRAKTHLELSYYTNPGIARVYGEPSPFLLRIPEHLVDWPKRPDPKNRAKNLQSLRRQVAMQKMAAQMAARMEVQPDVQRDVRKDMQPDVQRGVPESESEQSITTEATARRIRHAKYGEGTVVSESDMMIKAEFPGYGEKEFMKAFGGFELF